ncbi:MAG: Gfo/Idh/MocA family oxidoreductase [Planctomycetaceae bacterium]
MTVTPSGVSRRQFLGGSACNAVGLAAGLVGFAAGAAGGISSNRVRIGVIGVRRQGRKIALELARQPDAEVTFLCDVDESVLDRAVKEVLEAGAAPRRSRDFRELLDDSRVDAVAIATPDHSHAALAIEALRAGKDIYLETPVCHTLDELTVLQKVAIQSGRVVQTGHFERSLAHVRNAVEFVRSGRLGAVPLAKAWAVHRRPAAPIATAPVKAPAGVDYDQWLYPLAERPFDPQRFHRGWPTYWDYGSGELGTRGVALLDLACWGLDVSAPERVTASGSRLAGNLTETPDTLIAAYSFPDVTIQWEHRQWSNHPPEGRSAALAFYGERGTLVLDRGGWKVYDTNEPVGEDGRADLASHLRGFIDAVRSRSAPAASLDSGIVAARMCHLGNIAFRQGREIRINAESGLITGDETASALAAGHYRPGIRLA